MKNFIHIIPTLREYRPDRYSGKAAIDEPPRLGNESLQ